MGEKGFFSEGASYFMSCVKSDTISIKQIMH